MGDTLQVQDGANRLRFAPDGRFVTHERVDLQRLSRLGRYYASEECRVPSFAADYLVVCWNATRTNNVNDSWMRVTGFARVAWSLDQVDTIATFFVHDGRIIRRPLHPTGPPWFVISPLGTRGIFRLSGRDPKILYARSDAYRIEIYRVADASHILTVARHVPRRIRTPVEVDLAMRWGPHPPTVRRELRADDDRFPVADSLSIAIDFLLDEMDFLWVRLGPHGDESDAVRDVVSPDGVHVGPVPLPSGDYDVFSPDGLYLGTVKLLPGFRIFEIGEDYILGVHRDDFDVEHVSLYTLQRTVTGSSQPHL
ncbi:MAG: hypothetical protein ACREL7_08275 [Longimicrobiales bacterium]